VPAYAKHKANIYGCSSLLQASNKNMPSTQRQRLLRRGLSFFLPTVCQGTSIGRGKLLWQTKCNDTQGVSDFSSHSNTRLKTIPCVMAQQRCQVNPPIIRFII